MNGVLRIPLALAIIPAILMAGLARAGAPSLYQVSHVRLPSGAFDPTVIDAQAIAPDPELLQLHPQAVHLPLFDGGIDVEMTGFARRAVDDITWTGKVTAAPGAQVILTARRGVLIGLVTGLEQTYLIETTSTGQPVLKAVDQAAFPQCAGGVPGPSAPLAVPDPAAMASAPVDSGSQIDVLVMYTPQARNAAGGVAAIEATAQSAVDITNAAFDASNVDTRFKLVHTALADRNDSGNIVSDLYWLQADSATASLRDSYGADMVSLLVSNGGGYCGVGFVQRDVGPDFAVDAFQVTARNCAVGNLSWAHEHGHNMGMEHDPANGISPGSASYPWSFAHYVNGSYRTVMSYSNQCASGCTRVARFSNPNVSYNGAPTGIADQRDNHRTANLVRDTVANFRQAVCGSGLPYDLVLEYRSVATTEVFEACASITAGPDFEVTSTGDVTFISVDQVILRDGFRVAEGGLFGVDLP